MTGALPEQLQPDARGAARAFWDAAARGMLVLPRCTTCASLGWPPRNHCHACGSTIEWVDASGCGTVYTYTVVRQHAEPYFAARVPYVVAMIELAEGPRIMSNIVGCDVGAIRIGMPVHVVFATVGGISLPLFEPDGLRE